MKKISNTKKKKKIVTEYSIWKMSEIVNLTSDQHKALLAINKWLKDPNDLFLCLSGSAGTGKSTLIKRIINDNKLYLKNICVAAPTHKAKEVISIITGIKTCKTVAELLGLKLNYDITEFNINQISFVTDKNKAKIGSFSLIFIDEGSMVNNDAFNYINRLATMYKTKILYIGDSFQINPVKEDISPIFKNIPNIVLNEIVRQKGTNPISTLIALAREAVRLKDDSFIDFCKKNLNNEQMLYEGYNIYDSPRLAFDNYKHFYSLSNDTFFIHYTNDVVVAWNKKLRDEIINSEVEYTTNDRIVGYNTILNSNNAFDIQNSVVYSITEVAHKATTISNRKISFFALVLKNDIGEYSDIHVIKKESINDFKVVAAEMIQKSIRDKHWRTYYNFKDTYLLDRKIELYEGQFIDKSLDYSYGITAHKSQGSTYEYVFINLKNIMRNKNIRERNRLIYVALSRASRGITILI